MFSNLFDSGYKLSRLKYWRNMEFKWFSPTTFFFIINIYPHQQMMGIFFFIYHPRHRRGWANLETKQYIKHNTQYVKLSAISYFHKLDHMCNRLLWAASFMKKQYQSLSSYLELHHLFRLMKKSQTFFETHVLFGLFFIDPWLEFNTLFQMVFAFTDNFQVIAFNRICDAAHHPTLGKWPEEIERSWDIFCQLCQFQGQLV